MRLSRPAAAIAALTACLAGAAPVRAVPPAGPVPAARSVTSQGHRSVGSLPPGTPVRVEPLADGLRPDGAGRAWVLDHVSTSWNGHRTVVSGTLALPRGSAPPGGWPVVSFGHGLSGLADGCAPSVTGPSAWERVVRETLVRAGFAIAVTDYQGVGTPGPGIVGTGTTDARTMADIVRAARRTAPVSRDWESLGYSIGAQASLFAGSSIGSYAPELRHVGSIAMAPPTQWTGWMSGLRASGPSTTPVPAAVVYLSDVLARVHPDRYRVEDWFTARGMAFADRAQSVCIDRMAEDLAGVTFRDLVKDPEAFTGKLVEMVAELEVPVRRFPRPVYIAHGTDDVLPVALSELTARQLAAAGTDVTFVPVPGADHITLLPRVAPDVLAWTLFSST